MSKNIFDKYGQLEDVDCIAVCNEINRLTKKCFDEQQSKGTTINDLTALAHEFAMAANVYHAELRLKYLVTKREEENGEGPPI